MRDGLIEAFRLAPGQAIYTPDRGEILVGESFTEHTAEWNLVALTYWCLGKDRTRIAREARTMVLHWAAAMARSEDDAAEMSLRELCRVRGWSWSTFQRRVNDAVTHLTTCMIVASHAAHGLGLALRTHPHSRLDSETNSPGPLP